MYTESQLIDFGNYLLSQERTDSISNPNALNVVGDWDLKNWKEKEGVQQDEHPNDRVAIEPPPTEMLHKNV